MPLATIRPDPTQAPAVTAHITPQELDAIADPTAYLAWIDTAFERLKPLYGQLILARILLLVKMQANALYDARTREIK